MGFLDQVARGAELRTASSGLARPANWLLDAFSSNRSASGQRVTVDKAMGVAPVWSAVSIIAETVGQLPFKVYRDIGEGDIVVARDHRAYRMLHAQPNPVTPAHRFWSTVTAHLLLWGNAYIEKIRVETGLVEELWLIDPATVTVQWDSNLRRKSFVEQKAYGERRTLSADQVLHITGLSLNGLTGESVISRCRNMLGTAMARDEFEGGFYQRGAVLRGIVQHPGELKADGIKNLRESINGIYGGSGNAHQIGVLEENAEFKPLSMPMSDMEFVASQQMTRTDVAIMFKLPPAYLGGSTGDSLTYATVESNQIQFAQNSIAPWVNTIAKAVGADLGIFPFQSWYPEFVLEGLMRGDHKSRAEFYSTMFALKDEKGRRALDVDEIRSRENLPPAEIPEQPDPAPPAALNGNGDGQMTPEQIAAMVAG